MPLKNEGGLNINRTNRHNYFETIKGAVLSPVRLAAQVATVTSDPIDLGCLRVLGSNFTPLTRVYADGKYCLTHFLSDKELQVVKPEVMSKGTSLAVKGEKLVTLHKKTLAKSYSCITIREISIYPDKLLKTSQPFSITVDFLTSGKSQAILLFLEIVFPDGLTDAQYYEIKPDENKVNKKIIEGIKIGRGGNFEIRCTIYDNLGNADFLERIYQVVPSNPVQLYVYPQHSSWGTGSGAAEYRSGENKYYCEGRWVVSNGNSYAITVGPRIRCRVSDSGLGELANFTFNISQTTIPANSSRTLYVYTSHGSSSDVYSLFKKFGDAKYEFWLQSSEGDKYDWNVWVAMAQVGVTANFVGNFTNNERLKVIDIIDNHSTGIYAQVDCYFTENTPILEIPSSNSDWHVYRDIHVEEDKDGVCVDSDEADDMRDEWSSPSTYNDRIDIFFVESFSGDSCASSLGGFSPVDGPTGKGGSNSGIVIDVKDLNILTSSWGEETLGVVIAHEVGHYLGISGHTTLANNFMNASIGANSTNITYDQWKDMRGHDFVKRNNT
jgi:hypothetical protein